MPFLSYASSRIGEPARKISHRRYLLNHLAVHPANIGPQFAHHALQGGAFAFQLEHAPEQIGRGSQRPRVRGILEAKTHPRLLSLAPLDPGAANLFLVREI